ncbi:hypothetical protein PFISCL1PPCAC_27986, partial [Pristionchus fissidentatus]
VTLPEGEKFNHCSHREMRIVLFLLFLVPIIDSVVERSNRNDLLTFDEWDLNGDCFVTYDEFLNYFLDQLFTIRMYQARVAVESRSNYLREETYDEVAGNIMANVSLLDGNGADERTVIRHLLYRLRETWKEMSPESIQAVFKLKSIINTTFWHRP